MFILVRAAHAQPPRRWKGADRNRPLSQRGRQQAEGLRHNLSALEDPQFLSSGHLRCVQTLEPLARHHHAQVGTSPLLAPSVRSADLDPFARGEVRHGTVLCTHAGVVSRLITHWRRHGVVTFADDLTTSGAPAVTEKGAAWIVVDADDGLTAHYLQPLHIGPVLEVDTGSTPVGIVRRRRRTVG